MYLPVPLLLNYFTFDVFAGELTNSATDIFDVFAGELTNSATDITEMRWMGVYIKHWNSRIAQEVLVENP
jgi:hypothetical protein